MSNDSIRLYQIDKPCMSSHPFFFLEFVAFRVRRDFCWESEESFVRFIYEIGLMRRKHFFFVRLTSILRRCCSCWWWCSLTVSEKKNEEMEIQEQQARNMFQCTWQRSKVKHIHDFKQQKKPRYFLAAQYWEFIACTNYNIDRILSIFAIFHWLPYMHRFDFYTVSVKMIAFAEFFQFQVRTISSFPVIFLTFPIIFSMVLKYLANISILVVTVIIECRNNNKTIMCRNAVILVGFLQTHSKIEVGSRSDNVNSFSNHKAHHTFTVTYYIRSSHVTTPRSSRIKKCNDHSWMHLHT